MNTTLETSTNNLSAKEPSWLTERRSAGLDQFKEARYADSTRRRVALR
jgi:hypothetical protein